MIVDVFSSDRGYIRLERVDGEWRTVEWWRDWPSWKRESEYVMNWETEKWAREYVHDESWVSE